MYGSGCSPTALMGAFFTTPIIVCMRGDFDPTLIVLPTGSRPGQKRCAIFSLIRTEVALGISSAASKPRPRTTGVPMVLRKFRVTELYLISKGGAVAYSGRPGSVTYWNMPLLERLSGARTAAATLRTPGIASK